MKKKANKNPEHKIELNVVEKEYEKQAIEYYQNAVKVYEAMKLAVDVHGDQKYGKAPIIYPYIYHLESVVKIIQNVFPLEYRNKAELMIAGWLHDTVEDQPDKISFEKIKELYGETVCDIVKAVTDERDERGFPLIRKERAKRLYPKLKENNNALILKLCDRIANLEFCITMMSVGVDNLFDMYSKEYAEFRKNLFADKDDEFIEQLWGHLDKLVSNPNFFLR
jgi:(p)ppGpp synthase/HD superfamily hydrolase